jgi:hypothetical protein
MRMVLGRTIIMRLMLDIVHLERHKRDGHEDFKSFPGAIYVLDMTFGASGTQKYSSPQAIVCTLE